jgi:hypothetical protein
MLFCKRGNIADKLQPRNINVSFTNKSNVAIDLLIFKFYSDQLVIDVETGIVNTLLKRSSPPVPRPCRAKPLLKASLQHKIGPPQL